MANGKLPEKGSLILRFVGPAEYSCGIWEVKTGEQVAVDLAKARQLLTDFPKQWEIVEYLDRSNLTPADIKLFSRYRQVPQKNWRRL